MRERKNRERVHRRVWELLPWYGVVNPTYLFILIWVGVAVGIARDRLRTRELWLLWLPVVYALAMALVFYGSPRMRAPVEPLLAVVAAAGLVEYARTRGGPAAVWAAGAAAAAIAALALLAEPLKALGLAALRGAGIWRS